MLKLIRGGRSIEEMAALLGVHHNTLANYERGDRLPDIDFLARFSQNTGARFDQLLEIRLLDGGHPENFVARVAGPARPAGAEALGPGFVLVPRYDIQAAAGAGAFVDRELVVDHLAFKEAWVRRVLRADPAKLVLIEATGDSMEPVIRSGDLLLLDTGVDAIRDDSIYVLVKESTVLVKRVQRFLNGAVTIKSDNPAYGEDTLAPEAVGELRVAGRVRWIARLI